MEGGQSRDPCPLCRMMPSVLQSCINWARCFDTCTDYDHLKEVHASVQNRLPLRDILRPYGIQSLPSTAGRSAPVTEGILVGTAFAVS